MTYEELKIKLDLYDPIDVLCSVGSVYDDNRWFVVCDEGDCHLFKTNGEEDDINQIDVIRSFMICEDIKKIVIPDSVTNIGWYTFADCGGLTNVTIGSGMTKIGHLVFDGCNKLKSVVFKGKMLNEVKALTNYPWEIEDESIIRCV